MNKSLKRGLERVRDDIKNIMEAWDETLIPIVADMEVTTTTWADKYEVKTLEEFYNV